MSSEPRWLPRIVVEAMHLDQLREHGGLQGLRDEGALESALARARQKFHYGEEVVDLAELAAAYAFGIARSHPFRDGNKRTAFLAMIVFLGLNGLEFDAPEGDAYATILKLAAGEFPEDELASWIRQNVKPTK